MRCRTRHIILSLLLVSACKQSYLPPVIAHPPDYLVVEGFVCNDGKDSTTFTVSRTVALNDSSVYSPVTDVAIKLEDSTGQTWSLTQTQKGTYAFPPYSFPSTTKYRLHFSKGPNEYASDYFPLIPSPPIDSVTWIRSDDPLHLGVTISASTHDPQNNTHYYRWACEETWKYHVKYYPNIYWDGSNIQLLPVNNKYYCWTNDNSNSIVLASSTQLSQDLIYKNPVIQIPLNSQKLQIKYSVLVKQYALTKEAFEWWQILQKNTEQIGSIFGVQPSGNNGNLHCLTDTSQKVIGFAGGGNIQRQRIFISNDDVQPWSYNDDCIKVDSPVTAIPRYIARGYLLVQLINPVTVTMSHDYCIDCTLTGTTIKPSFWQ